MPHPSSAAPSVLFERDIPAHNDLQVCLETPGADLSLRPGASNQVTIEIVAPALEEDSAEELLERLGVSLNEEQDRITLTTAAPFQSEVSGWASFGVPVEVRVSLPHHLRVEARCSGGTLQVVGLAGTFEVDSFGGALQVEDVEGSVEVRSRASAVRLRHLTGERLTIDAAAGRLSAEDIRVDEARLSLRACQTRLERIVGALDISTAHGEMTLAPGSGTLVLQGSRTPLTLSLDEPIPATVSAIAADVELLLDARTAANLEVSARSAVIAESLSFNGEQENGTVAGRLGAGGPLIAVESTRGAVSCEAG